MRSQFLQEVFIESMKAEGTVTFRGVTFPYRYVEKSGLSCLFVFDPDSTGPSFTNFAEYVTHLIIVDLLWKNALSPHFDFTKMRFFAFGTDKKWAEVTFNTQIKRRKISIIINDDHELDLGSVKSWENVTDDDISWKMIFLLG